MRAENTKGRRSRGPALNDLGLWAIDDDKDGMPGSSDSLWVRRQFRAEAINALNHPQFTAPNTTPTSTAFGTVTGEFAWPRVIQFGLKALF